jgi:hypothetical protein
MSVTNLFAGFGINLAIALLIVRGIYYPVQHDKSHIFTFVAFNTVIFFVMAFLADTQLSVGVGFGLFAIFSVLRYRASEISTREMTYLFILIALPVMNSILIGGGDWTLLLAANFAVVAVLYVLEQGWGFSYEVVRSIKYERIELIKPEHYDLLLADLRQRTGLPIQRVEIGRINLVDDTVELSAYFAEAKAARSRRPAESAHAGAQPVPAVNHHPVESSS